MGCNCSAFKDKNDELVRTSSKRENVIKVIPTGMSLPNLHTIENVIKGNPEFEAVADILKT